MRHQSLHRRPAPSAADSSVACAWERRIRYPIPPDMGGARPYGVLEQFLIGDYREDPPLIADTPPGPMLDVTLPAFGHAVLATNAIEAGDCAIGEGAIENAWYRIKVDAASGGAS